MESIWQDVRYGARMLLKDRAMTLVAVLSLALGIGGTTAIFSLVDAVFLRGVPVEDPERVVNVYGTDALKSGAVADWNYFPISHPNLADLEQQTDVFDGVASFAFVQVALAGEGDPEQVWANMATGDYFEVLGVRAAVGRTFTPDDDRSLGGHPIVVLSDSLWRRRWGGDPSIVGRDILLNGRAYTVIGVTPPGFRGLQTLGGPDLWVPMSMRTHVFAANPLFEQRRWRILNAVARLAPGVSLEQAESAVATVGRRLEQEYPAENPGRGITLVTLGEAAVDPNQRGVFVRAGGLLMTAVALVLLIACANIANLLLVRASVRGREIAVRLAQGATRLRLIRQLMTESVLLAILGGAGGLLVARGALDLLWGLRPPNMPENMQDAFGLDGRVLVFGLLLSLGTGLLFGLAPALEASRSDLVSALKSGVGQERRSRFGGRGLRDVLVIGQVALSLVALVGAGLFVRSLRNAQSIDPGFEAERLVQATVNLGPQGYDPERAQGYHRQALERLAGLPGVARVSVAGSRLMTPAAAMRTVLLEGQQAASPGEGMLVRTGSVGLDYFETVGVPLLSGRDFGPQDRADAPLVAIVNRTFAKRLAPDGEAIGKRFGFFGEPGLIEVVGVAEDSQYAEIGEEPQPYIYMPLAQRFAPEVTFMVRTNGAPEPALEPVRREIQALDRNVLVAVETIAQSLAPGLWAPRVGAALLAGFGLLALAMAAIGLYGVTSYSVDQRRREIGIRSALGAQRGDVLRLVVRQTMLVVAVGMAVGIGLAVVGLRLIANLLYGVGTADPLTFAAILVLLALVGLVASLIPARRASRVEPVTVLR